MDKAYDGSTGSEHTNPTRQRPGSNSSIGELLLLVYKGGFNRWE